MTVALRKAGVTKDVTAISIHQGGSLKTVTEGWIRKGGALLQFFSTLSIALSKSSVTSHVNSSGTTTVTTPAVTAIPSGTIGTVSYVWSRTDLGAHPWTIISGSTATAQFSTDVDPNTSQLATFKCTATDQAGQTIASSDVHAACANVYFSSSGGPYL